MKKLILAALVLSSFSLFANEAKHEEAAAAAPAHEAAAPAGVSKKEASAECKKEFKAEKKKATKAEFTACVEGKMGKK